MYGTIQTNGYNLNGPENSNSTTIRRTLVERGIRSVDNDNNYQNGPSTTLSAIKKITKQHKDEQRELQELNTKFATYLDHIQSLENYNGQLLAELGNLKEKCGGEIDQIHTKYSPELNSLRHTIDNSLRDQILQELQLKQHEYDIWQTQQRINALDYNSAYRLNALQEELNISNNVLEQIKNQFDQRSEDLIQQRTNLEDLVNELNGLQNELVNHRLERIMIENELQTLQEHLAFQDATYQAQREEILSLDTPVLNVSNFYRNELAHAISDIRQDFEILSQSQLNELEEYYRIKTEQIQEIAQENQRKRLLESETTDYTINLSSLKDIRKDYKRLQIENNQLQTELDGMLDDLTEIRDEHTREKERQDQELNLLRQEITNKQDIVDNILENNVSLRFELSTYRRLLNSEDQRLNRLEQEQQSPTSLSSSPNQKVDNHSIQKMAVKKTSRGSIIFDSVDLINDCVIITYEKFIGKEQSLGNWTIHRQNDQQPEIVYQFPSSFVLRPRKTIRILSKNSPQSAKSRNNALIADQIDTWGLGQVMITRLLDTNNEEKAIITQTRLKT